MPADPSIAIRHKSGTYFKSMGGRGPIYGANLTHARKFCTKADAVDEVGWHHSFEDCEVVDAKDGHEPPRRKRFWERGWAK